MKHLSLLCACLCVNVALAATPPGLPPDESVRRALEAHPDALAAASEIRLETANRDRLTAGSYEWNLRLGGQQRRARPPIGVNEDFKEWNVALERPLRLPGKAETDAQMGAAGIARAEAMYGDAMHEIKRDLLKSWFAWLKESATAKQWAAQVELIDRQTQMVKRRLQLGDAARLESIQAEAALAQARAQWLQAASRQQNARETLQRRYPGLAIVEPAEIGQPQAIAGGEEEWQAAVAEHSHELLLARQQTRLAMLAAERQRQDRTPDPSVGLTFASERGGEEHIVGAFISIPLPGNGRRAAEQGAQAAADAARYREAALLRQIAIATASNLQAARAAQAAWQASHAAAERLEQAASMAARAYQLGEGSLNDWLTAMRLANESRLASQQNQLDALEQSCRLLLDTHRLWEFEE